MTEGKFKFNPETLEFENKKQSKIKRTLISALSIFIGSIFIFIIIYIIFSYYYNAKYINNSQSEYKVLEKQYKILLERKKKNDKYLNELIEKDKKIYQAVFKSSPDNTMFNDINPYSKFLNSKTTDIVKENNERLVLINQVTEKQKAVYKQIIDLLQKTETSSLENIPAIQPIFNKKLKYPVYGFGERIDQVYKTLIFHPGIDYAIPEGTNVFATADGIVEKSGHKRGLGKRIIINHGNGYKTTYAHLSEIYFKKGKRVKRGNIIGKTGMSGKSLIPHLHYEIHYNGKEINPVNYFFLDLEPNEFLQIRLQSAKSGLSLD